MNNRKTHSTEATAAKAGFNLATGYRIQKDPCPPSENGLRAAAALLIKVAAIV